MAGRGSTVFLLAAVAAAIAAALTYGLSAVLEHFPIPMAVTVGHDPELNLVVTHYGPPPCSRIALQMLCELPQSVHTARCGEETCLALRSPNRATAVSLSRAVDFQQRSRSRCKMQLCKRTAVRRSGLQTCHPPISYVKKTCPENGPARIGLAGPASREGRHGATRLIPRAPFQLASVKSVPIPKLILVSLSRLGDLGL